jgi:hypothetical protein
VPGRSRLLTATAILAALVAAGVIGWAIRGPGTTTATSPGTPPGLYPQPTRIDHGVPVGWPHTKAGAVAAAAAYEKAFVQPGFLTSAGQRKATLAAIGTPSFATAYLRRYGRDLDRYTREVPFGRDLARGVPSVFFQTTLAYHVPRYDAAGAAVELWTVGVVGNAASRPPVAAWSTSTLQLVWTGTDWKVSGASRPRPGPVPRLEDSATNVKAFLAQAGEMKETHDVP